MCLPKKKKGGGGGLNFSPGIGACDDAPQIYKIKSDLFEF